MFKNKSFLKLVCLPRRTTHIKKIYQRLQENRGRKRKTEMEREGNKRGERRERGGMQRREERERGGC